MFGSKWKTSLCSLAALFTLISQLLLAQAAQAETGGYPYADYNGPGSNASLSYWTDNSGNGYSPYKYVYRNCTDFVAWKLDSANGWKATSGNSIVSMGNAKDWARWASDRSYSVDLVPAIGAVAWWSVSGSMPYGHVAYVTAISSDGKTVDIQEYNRNWDGTFGTRSIARTAPSGYIHFKDLSGIPAGPPQPVPTGAGPIKNGGFNQNTAHWTASGSANLAHNVAGGQGSGTNPYEGSGFAVSNAGQAGDSIHQTSAVSMSTHDTFCASARVVTVGVNPGSSGMLALWLLGTTNDVSTVAYETLPGSNNWQEITTCVMATGSRAHIKVQLYPTPGTPTVGIDGVDVRKTLNVSGGFNNGNSYWNLQPGTNLATYTVAHNTGNQPYEGSAFAATNTSHLGGGFFQDLPRNIAPGDTFCAEAQVVTVGEIAGASGALAVHLTGSTTTEQSTYHFDNLSARNAWRHVKTCATATTPHSNVRVQVYPSAGGPTLGVDALDVHASIALNGGFNGSSGHWSAHGSLGYATFANFSGTTPYEGTAFEIAQTNLANSSLAQTRAYGWSAGDTFCAEATVVSGGGTQGAGGVLAVWLLGTTTDVSTYSFSALPAGNAWLRIKTCVMASGTTSNGILKVQIYPSTNNLPLAVDTVDVH